MNVRRPAPADAVAVAELIREYDEAYGSEPDTTPDEILREWAELDLDRDAWLLELDGRLAACAAVIHRGARLSIDGYVHPGCTGRGLGTEILRLGESRARELGATRVHEATLHADERGRLLFEANGYAFVRAFLRMEIELGAPPPEPVLPEPLRLRALTEADDEAAHAAVEEAFADHWEHQPVAHEQWLRRVEGQDRSLWLAVWDGDEIAGASLNQLRHHGAGWVDMLATRRPWRGRGVARALLLATFGELYRRGQPVVRLAVDASNPTGAVQLYEQVGMRPIWRADVYEKHL